MSQSIAWVIARRAAVCKAWRWIPGMLDSTSGRRVVEVNEGLPIAIGDGETWTLKPDALPDLDDPATLGCLLALVREAWCDPGIYARQASRRLCIVWAVYSYGTGSRTYAVADTEAEALVDALEAGDAHRRRCDDKRSKA